mmetsp:Transcript_17282/g.16619  ORF Transcript_17282/g.16619 Transcript_17282/m.16619 type:complete len:109 (-) Transcript_17282:37-363(-)
MQVLGIPVLFIFKNAKDFDLPKAFLRFKDPSVSLSPIVDIPPPPGSLRCTPIPTPKGLSEILRLVKVQLGAPKTWKIPDATPGPRLFLEISKYNRFKPNVDLLLLPVP